MAERDLNPERERRQAALAGMERFADQHGVTSREWEEVDKGDHIAFVGRTDDGREFALGYDKETPKERDRR